MRKEDYLISLIVPVYNEKETIELFVNTVEQKLASIWQHIEIVFVDDGSKDNSAQIVEGLIAKGKPISLIKLSRNFGKEAAMSAALDLVKGDAVVPMDVDLQDPPELVLEFVRIWKDEGIDTVYGVRVDRSQDTEIKRVTSGGFYYVFNKLSNKVKIPANVGDFRLIDRKVVELVRKQHEKAAKILKDNRAKLDELAKYLYDKETITGEEFMSILNAQDGQTAGKLEKLRERAVNIA